MQRLVKENNKNGASDYDQIFKVRAKQEPNWQDVRRWKELIKYFRGGKLVDLGCLDSRIWDLIKDSGVYYGLDLAEEAIKEMNEKYSWKGAKFIVRDLYNTGIKDEAFDYAILGEVLEHLDLPRLAIREAFRMLKPGGVLAISVPLEEANEPGAVDSERHIWSFSKQDITDLVLPYSSKIKFKVLRSKWFPYKYAWPTILCFVWKKIINN